MLRASRSKRSRNSGRSARCPGRTLMATMRLRRVSRARYTSPIPPAPSGAMISYGPSLVPVERVSAIGGWIIALETLTGLIVFRRASSLMREVGCEDEADAAGFEARDAFGEGSD